MTPSNENTKLLQYKQLSIDIEDRDNDEFSYSSSSSSISLDKGKEKDEPKHGSSASTSGGGGNILRTIRNGRFFSSMKKHWMMKYVHDPSTDSGSTTAFFTCFFPPGFFLVGLLAVSLFVLVAQQVLRLSMEQQQQQHHHVHILPTVLSIRSDVNMYVNALSNVLYDDMKEATFQEEEDIRTANHSSSRGSNDVLHRIKVDKTLIGFHENLTLSWDVHELGLTGDVDPDSVVIALYCPSHDASMLDPKKFVDAATLSQIQYTMQAQNLLAVGSSRSSDQEALSLPHSWMIPSFPVIKEDSCEFRLWSRTENNNDNGNTTVVYDLLATTGSIAVKHGSVVPTAIHLALTENTDEMRVHFSTGGSSEENIHQIPIVLYGKEEEWNSDLTLTHDPSTTLQFNFGSTTTYTASDMCQAPANVDEPGKFSSPHLLHSVIMVNLEADCRYYYKVGLLNREKVENMMDLEANVVWSDVFSFQSPLPAGISPGDGGDDESFSFLVYADQGVSGYGGGDDGNRVAIMTEREVKQNGIRAVHHFGDLSYAQGASHVWDMWLDMVSMFTTSVPLMVGVGNHEYDHTEGGGIGRDPSGLLSPGGYQPKWGNFGTDSNGECGVPTSKRFIMPANGNGVYWYSFDYGLVHTIMLSSEHDLSPGSEQYLWLERDLSMVNRTLTPWIILEAHRPMYMIEDIAANTVVGIHFRQNFEDLLKRYQVDLYLAGHYHAYFRSCPGLYQSKCNNGGLTHITIGTAGAELDTVPLLRKPWSAFFSAEWGYGRITVANSTAMKFEFVSDQDGLTKDSTWLFK